MKTRLVAIGNSQGNSHPQTAARTNRFVGEVKASAADGTLVVRSVKRLRANGVASLQEMA